MPRDRAQTIQEGKVSKKVKKNHTPPPPPPSLMHQSNGPPFNVLWSCDAKVKTT